MTRDELTVSILQYAQDYAVYKIESMNTTIAPFPKPPLNPVRKILDDLEKTCKGCKHEENHVHPTDCLSCSRFFLDKFEEKR